MVAGAPAVAVAWIVTPVRPAAETASDCAPATEPRVHEVKDATPEAFVVNVPAAGETLPFTGVNVTVSP